jgi:hypothetical protein
VGAPSLIAAKPRLSVADSSPGWGLGEGEPSYTPVSPDPALTVFLATAAPWEPYFTGHPRTCNPITDKFFPSLVFTIFQETFCM